MPDQSQQEIGLAQAPGEDNSSFLETLAPAPLPIAQAIRAVSRMFGGPRRQSEENEAYAPQNNTD